MTVIELKKYIYDNSMIEFILNEIGCGHIVYHPNKDYFSCSNCNGDNKTAINIKNSEYLKCKNYTRGKFFNDESDLLTLVQYNKQLSNNNFSFWDTVKYLHNILGLRLTVKKQDKKREIIDPLYIFKKVAKRKKKQNILEFNVLDESELHDFIPCVHIDWFREGIMPWSVKKFGLAYSYKYKRNIIPLRYWLTGELLGFNMRTSIENYKLFDIKKYFLTPSYPKHINLFGLWENKESILKAKYVIVYESEKSVLKRDSLNDSTGVALSGHDLSDEQVKILIGLDVEIIIALDNDVGLNYTHYCCEKFYGIRKVSYIYDTWELIGQKDSPADAENKIFEFFMQYRTLYDYRIHNKYIKSLKKVGV